MRKILFLAGLIFAFAFTIKIYSADTTAFTNPFSYKFNIVNPQEIYKNFINSLNPVDITNLDKASLEFNKLFNGLSPHQTNAAFAEFWDYYIETADSIALRFVYNDKYIPFAGIDDYDIYPEKYSGLKNEYNTLTKNDFNVLAALNHYGFKFDLTDGLLFINFSNPGYILHNMNTSLSIEMKEYITQTFKEADKKLMNHGQIILPLEKLAERVIWWENFLNQNPNFVFITDCELTYKYYMSLLFSGDENTVLAGYSTKSIGKRYRQAYEIIIQKYSGTKTAEVIGKYYRLLQDNGFTVNREIESFAEHFQP